MNIPKIKNIPAIACFLAMAGISACNNKTAEKDRKKEPPVIFTDTISVTATAYNSLSGQGEGNPAVTSWGDTLNPELRSIAVSRDLIEKGLDYGTPVKIEGFEEIFVVNDKMHSRWKNKIDIYMGINREKAMEWGRRKVKISFPGQPVEKEKAVLR